MQLPILAILLLAQLPEAAGPFKPGEWKQFVTFEVRETAGLAREQEPVEVAIRLPTREVRVVRWSQPPEHVISQVVEARPDGAAFNLRLVFPATVPARSSVRYRVYWDSGLPAASYSTPLKLRDETRVGWVVENGKYVADCTKRTIEGKDEDSGQLRALTLKLPGLSREMPGGISPNEEVTLLRSTGPRMHWAPNFQRVGLKNYNGIARWEPVQKVEKSKGPVAAETRRWGFHAEYPEIALAAVYRFYAFVPYFRFRSEMRLTKPMGLFWLTNDEMTMDAFFTHVAWPGKAVGAVMAATFDERQKILEKDPIPADAPWVCFFNQEKGYGFGSVRLEHDTRNTTGGPSPLYLPHTAITDAAQGGKYWKRHLISQKDTPVPAGSRYLEENAYVVFRLRPGAPAEALGEFLEWEAKLRKPLVARLEMQESQAHGSRAKAKAKRKR